MARTIGCCGSPRVVPASSLEGLVAQADAYPKSSTRGRQARMRLAYSVVAAKAAQSGNHAAYARAMGALRGLGDGSSATLSTHGTIAEPETAAAEAPAIRATLTSLINTVTGGSAQVSATWRQIQGIGGILTGLAQIATGIASAVPGSDPNAVAAANMVISWVRSLLTGTAPTVPTLDARTVQGLVSFCRFRSAINGIVLASTGAIITALTAPAATGGTVDTNAVTAVTTIGTWITGIVDGICNIPQVVAAAAALEGPARCAAIGPNVVFNATTGLCECAMGFSPQNCTPTGGCQCLPRPATAPAGPITLTPAQRAAIVASRTGRALTPAQQALLRVIPVVLVPGTLDPATLCAPGEAANPCTGMCDDRGPYAGTTCVDGVPTKSGGGAIIPLAVGAAALLFLMK
jgi:hypothetical protein